MLTLDDLRGVWLSAQSHALYTQPAKYSNWQDSYPSLGQVQLTVYTTDDPNWRAKLEILNPETDYYLLAEGNLSLHKNQLLLTTAPDREDFQLVLKPLTENTLRCRVYGEWLVLDRVG
ncbi:MAG: hypothetical protein MUE85_02525 [Microscillaceae bacterium]|jgi:hypothetical protein|nr:hypothetical protein [Microscillaceae bacterium]